MTEDKELQKCFLPFYGLTDLYKKCKEILATLSEYQKGQKEVFNQLGVEFTEFEGFGFLINADQPNHGKLIEYFNSPNNKWKSFVDAFVEKYEIQDPNNTIKI